MPDIERFPPGRPLELIQMVRFRGLRPRSLCGRFVRHRFAVDSDNRIAERNLGVNVKRTFLILALTFSLVAPLIARPRAIELNSRLRQLQGAAPAKVAAAKPASDIAGKVLANGLEIIVLEDHSVPVVTIELAVRNGSFTEPPELNGLSHLYEHMFFKANRAVANQEAYLQKIGQLGIAYNGETREEVVEYYFTTTSTNLRSAMNFMSDAVHYPLFE